MNSPAPYDAPPAYAPSEQFEHFGSVIDEKFDHPMILPPQQNEPGLAVASALGRGLQVPSRSSTCTSGFDYPDELIHYGISKDHWVQFTQVICEEAKLSRQQWTIVVGKGLGTLAVGGLMVGILGAIPAIFVTRVARRRQERRNLITALAGTQDDKLARHISHWNETFFQPRGVLIRVDLPDEYLNDIQDVDVQTTGSSSRPARRVRDKAAMKARVVIIPLDRPTPGSSRSST
ncbi:uncharacterized protein N7529_012127 [Penicillium soppii]|jgi:hypothetical protein|uniref:uncharacterized protein n=1 Tax=Penicillium soppii TaxID=69789 RepID=UPI0025482513|nr:uncharacterized protein N7529_012127 [Penicillium soppii]KAJ5852742.1 hypothetical protein N7529_012127 [Penicillium soppii]